jgi:ribosomal protein S18 acetylase RimI-like enzyme
MTTLRAMRPECFAAYKAAEVASFAEENVSSGRWQAEVAIERSLSEFDELLPQGLSTPNHFLFEILEGEDGETVGYVWFAAEERNGQRVAFIYDIQVSENYRRRGHAKGALRELECLAANLNLSRVSLHVAGKNTEAQALYEKLGFLVMGISLSKTVAREA